MGNRQSIDVREAAFEYVKDVGKGEARLRNLFATKKLTPKQKMDLFACRDQHGRTLLMVACLKTNVRAVNFLVSEGAPVGVQSQNGWSPLHYAATSKKQDKALDLMSILLAAHADPLVRDENSQTPFHVAQLGNKLATLRHLESRVCDFVGSLKIEGASSWQSGVGAVLGESARSKLISKFGGNWKTRWIVITRLRGSRKMAKFPQLRCPKCLAFQKRLDRDVPHITCGCGQVLIVPARQCNVLNCLTVYNNCNAPVPEVVYDLTDCSVQLVERAGEETVVEIRLSDDARDYVDPVYFAKPRVVENFRSNQRRFSIKDRSVLRLASTDIASLRLAHSALSRKVRAWPEPDRPVPLQGAIEHSQRLSSRSSNIAPLPPDSGDGFDQIPLAVAIDSEGLDSTDGWSASAGPPLPPPLPPKSTLRTRTPPQTPPRHDLTSAKNDSTPLRNDIPFGPALAPGAFNAPPGPPPPPPPPPVPVPAPMSSQHSTRAAPPFGASLTWQCPMCTFVNEPGREVCEMCESLRAAGSDAFQVTAGIGGGDEDVASIGNVPSAPLEDDVETAALKAAQAASILQNPASLSSRASSEDERSLAAFTCPITHQVMVDPVTTSDGQSYERKAIQEWFDKGNTTSPATDEQLVNLNLVPNLALKSAIQHYLKGVAMK